MIPSPNWRDSEAIIKARAALRDYDQARARDDLGTASGALSKAILLCEQAQQALWDEAKALAIATDLPPKRSI